MRYCRVGNDNIKVIEDSHSNNDEEGAISENSASKSISENEKEVQSEGKQDEPVHSFFKQKILFNKSKNPFASFNMFMPSTSNLSKSSSEVAEEVEVEEIKSIDKIESIPEVDEDIVEIDQQTFQKAASDNKETMEDKFNDIYNQLCDAFCCPKCGEALKSSEKCGCVDLLKEMSSSIKSQSYDDTSNPHNDSDSESDYDIKTWDKKKKDVKSSFFNEAKESPTNFDGSIFNCKPKKSEKNFFAKILKNPEENSDDYSWGAKKVVKSKFDNPKNMPW